MVFLIILLKKILFVFFGLWGIRHLYLRFAVINPNITSFFIDNIFELVIVNCFLMIYIIICNYHLYL